MNVRAVGLVGGSGSTRKAVSTLGEMVSVWIRRFWITRATMSQWSAARSAPDGRGLSSGSTKSTVLISDLKIPTERISELDLARILALHVEQSWASDKNGNALGPRDRNGEPIQTVQKFHNSDAPLLLWRSS